MAALFLTFLAVIVTGLGARDQATVAMLSARQGPRPALLLVAVAVSLATAMFAAWAAEFFIPLMSRYARQFMAAVALALGGLELLVLGGARKQADEPTLSLGAAAIVLVAHQATDAARFLVFAIAVAHAAPIQAGLGGAAGGVATIAIGALAPGLVAHRQLRRVRAAIGVVLIVLAVVIGSRAIG